MQKSFITLAAALALTTAGCNSNDQASSNEANLDNAVDTNLPASESNAASADTSMPTDAAGFAQAVAASDMFEIESGKLAADQGSSADVKSFAAQLQTDHSKSTADLKSAAQSSGVTVSPALDSEKQAMLTQLRAAKGEEFDRMFIDQQKTAHQKALDLLQNYSRSGDNAALKAFAEQAARVVQGHLEHANGMAQ